MSDMQFVVKVDRSKLVSMLIKERTAKAVRKACFDTEAEAKNQITQQVYTGTRNPKQPPTGATRASIYSDVGDHHGYSDAVNEADSLRPGVTLNPPVKHEKDFDGIVTVGTEYAPYVEYGTSKMAARPFMQPAVDKVKPEFEKVMQKILDGMNK